MKLVRRISESIAWLGGYLSGWLVPVMMVLIMFEVFMRYVLGRSPMVADEFSGYMLVAIAFLGVAYTWKEKGHVRITALISRLPQRVSSWIRLITLVLAFAFSIVLTQSSYNYMAFSFKVKMTSPSVWLFPWQGPQMTIAIGFTLMTVLIVLEIAKAIVTMRSGRSFDEEVGR